MATRGRPRKNKVEPEKETKEPEMVEQTEEENKVEETVEKTKKEREPELAFEQKVQLLLDASEQRLNSASICGDRGAVRQESGYQKGVKAVLSLIQ